MYLSVIWRILDGMDSGNRWRLGHRPALDGLRGVAIGLVLVGHLVPVVSTLGYVGVTVFFALSGFLITALLLDEVFAAGRVDLAAFYTRRARRLLPALLVVLAVVSAAGLIVGDLVTRGGVLAALFYVANIAKGHHWTDLGALGHTWSLSVEEQFYLAWPLVLLVAHRFDGRRGVASAASAGIAVSVALRVALWGPGAEWAIYSSSWCHADSLLVGCLLAALMPALRALKPVSALPLVAGLIVLGFVDGWWRYVALPLLAAVFTAGVIFGAVSRGTPWLEAKWLRWLGRRSYALYLWHYPMTFYAADRFAWWAAWPVILCASLVLAELSWRYVEQPFLRRGSTSDDVLESPVELAQLRDAGPVVHDQEVVNVAE